VHPTQLYESALGVAVAAVGAIALFVRWKKPLDGSVLFAAAATYAAGRIGIESLRGDYDRGVFGFFSTSQLVSAGLLATIAAVIVIRWKRRPAT
jgi:prolipoprotein diacylglyceryltransferase